MNREKIIYLDHAAATPLDPAVRQAMLPYLGEQYGNPSALYALGRQARKAIDDAREIVARILNCRATEIIFVSSGTESDNLAIFGMARQYGHPERSEGSRAYARPTFVGDSSASPQNDKISCGHIITTNFEHHAVLNPCKQLEKEGFEVTYLKVDHDGLVIPEQLKSAIRPDTIVISVMYANNEVGTVEPIAELALAVAEWKKEHRRKENDPPFFHTDACQAGGYLDISVKNLGVDLMTINGSKIYGPKGIGVLYVRRGVKLKPIIYGGGQEFGLRSGTENVAGIVGLAKALEIVHKTQEYRNTGTSKLRDALIAGILANIPHAELNGHPTKRLPNNVNIFIPGIVGDIALLYLDEHGIAASSGSACESSGPDPSHVIQALGKSLNTARSSLRFTLGRSTTVDDVDYVLKILPEIIKTLRRQ